MGPVRSKFLLPCSHFHSACLASIIRVTAFSEANSGDFTYTFVLAAIFTTAEQSMGIICACLPTIRPLISRLREMSKNHNDCTPNGDVSKDVIALRNRGVRPALDQSKLGESRTGFARLPGDIEKGLNDFEMTVHREAILTAHVGRNPSGFGQQLVTPETILRQPTFDQYDQHHARIGRL